MPNHSKNRSYADDDTWSIRRLLGLRLPPLLLGLVLGVVLSFTTSRFADVLQADIRIAFFIPFIVYMADAVGSQTHSIYIRDLRTKNANFFHYLYKESVLGLLFGIICGVLSAVVTFVWLQSAQLTLAVSLATFAAITTSPIVALIVTELLQLEHTDPAVGAGPIAAVIQDGISVLLFGLIASVIFF